MNWEENLRILIEKRFINEWDGTPISSVDFGLNGEFDQDQVELDKWVRIYHTIQYTENAEVGTRFIKARGIITVQCFTEKNSGEKESNILSNKAIKIFQNKNFDGLNCFTGTPVNLGVIGNWFVKNAKIDFVYNVFTHSN